MSKFAALLPDRVTRWTRVLVWLNLIVNIGIVGTGGLVRVTGSGLGCPEWPLWTEESLITTKEMGIHGFIEFGNRTLTGVLVVVALLTFLAVWNTRHSKLGLVGPAFWVGFIIIVQAIVGGITVWTDLHPLLVGIHFMFSATIVAVAALGLQRMRHAEPLPRRDAVRGAPLLWTFAIIVAVATWFTEIVGVLTTGSGPHAGDEAADRNGLDPAIMQHVHAWPGYVLLGALIIFVIIAFKRNHSRTKPMSLVLLGTVLVQIAIGVFQARTGLPSWSVIIHMLLAVTCIAMLSMLLVNARRDAAQRLEETEARDGQPVHIPVA